MGKTTKPVTPAKKKKIIADYAMYRNYAEVARMHGLSPTGVKKIVKADPPSAELFAQKDKEHTEDAIAYLAGQNDRMRGLLDKLIGAMDKKAGDVDIFTNIKDQATAFGIIIDKLIKIDEVTRERGAAKAKFEDDALSKALMELAGELDADQ